MDVPGACPVCRVAAGTWAALADHLVERAASSDGDHVMWLNRWVTRHRRSAAELVPDLVAALSGDAPRDDRVRR